MTRIPLIIGVVLVWGATSHAQDDSPPPGEPPQFWRASASQMGADVAIQLERPEYAVPRKAVYPEAMTWKKLRTATVGSSSRAFLANGNPITATDVLERLSKPTPVVVFVRYTGEDFKADPSPAYLGLLRKDTIVLVVAAEAVFDLRP